MRLVLFDIDGTLVWGGPAKESFHRAMRETYGTVGDFEGVSFSGKTDPQIARELLYGAGFGAAEVDEGFPALWARYLGYLEEGLVERPMEVLPGVDDLLDALRGLEHVRVALLTGNIEGGAKLKLGSAGLAEHFAVGGFGSDAEERGLLPAIALDRAREEWGAPFPAAEAVVVGDTPLDVACGKGEGTRTLAVATGHFAEPDLAAAGADHVLADFSDTDRVVSLLLTDPA